MTEHYTSHGGALHHFPWGPYVEEQVVASEGGDGYLVVKDDRAFDHWEIVCAWPYKPGVHVVHVRGGNELRTFYCPDKHLPPGVEGKTNG